MRCHSVQALWASTPPAHQVVTMVAIHNPPSLWTGGTLGDIIVWKLPSRPPDADQGSNQDLLPVALLCGHTASIVAFVTCGVDKSHEMEATGSHATDVSMMNGCEPNSCGVILSLCSDGWLCAWDCLTRRCRRRRKLPQWLGSPNSMASLLGTKRYVAIACVGCDTGSSSLTTTDEGDNNIRKLVDTARTMALERGSTNKFSKITVVIVDTSVLGVVQIVGSGLFGVAPVRAIAAVPEAVSLHKIMIADPAGHIQMWKVSLKGEEMDITASGEQEKIMAALQFQDKTDYGEDAKTVCFSPDGSYLLLIFRTNWVIVLTEDQRVVHQSLKRESKHGNADWIGGFFLSGGGTPVCMFLIWDAYGGATLFSLQKTSESLAAEEICCIPSSQTDHKLSFSFKYYQFLNSLLCVASGQSALPTPDMWVRLWLLPRSFVPLPGLHHADNMKNGVSIKQMSCRLYGYGDLRTPWASLASSQVISAGGLVDKSEMHVCNLQEESASCSFGTQWVTASMVLFDKAANPWALVLGFSHGIIKLISFRTSLQERERGLLMKNGITQDLNKHTGPIICLAEHNVFISVSGAQKYLLSGGMDCLTCIWDLSNGGQLVLTLHHHVTPVHQILLPPPGTYTPWSSCFITVGEDGCMALISLETLQVERMFIGHPTQPKQIAWDGIRGYLSCVCSNISIPFNGSDVLFMWDMKSGALERILRGAAAHSMYINFAHQLANDSFKIHTSSTSTLLHGEVDPSLPQYADKCQTLGPNLRRKIEGDAAPFLSTKQSTDEKVFRSNFGEFSSSRMIEGLEKLSSKLSQALNQGTKAALSESKDSSSGIPFESSSRNLFHKQPPIKGASPIPGVVALQFDLFTLMAPDLGRMGKTERENEHSKVQADNKATVHSRNEDTVLSNESLAPRSVDLDLASSLGSTEGRLLRTSLAFLHLWGADKELDRCLQEEWWIVQPLSVHIAAGFTGDKGATTLQLPGWESTFEMWKLSADFCALRSLTLVATALRMATLCRHTSNANSALAAFYTRGIAEKFPKVKAPSLELYACFWQDPSEHVRMAARSLFHCAVSRAIPPVLCARGSPNSSPDEAGHMEHGYINTADSLLRLEQKLVTNCAHKKPTWPDSISSSAEIIDWLESHESQSWTEVVEGTIQDARAGRIIVASALAVWYPGLVKPELAPSVAPYLIKLVKAMVDRHSAVAAELLGDGMESVWRHLIADEIPQLICDVFLLIECLSGGGAAKPALVSNSATAMTIRETLIGSLLPSLAMADVPSFLQIIQTQLASASASSSVHLVSLMTTMRIIRGAPRVVVFYLSQVMSIILQTMNTGRHCHQTAMAAIREMVRVYPMVALHQNLGKLAVGDAAGDVHSLAIHVYDLNSASKLRDLDASGPPGHPALLLTDADGSLDAGGISALAFSEDGEGVVAFSQHGLMIRWWSLSAVWWEKLSRVHTPLQCNKLVLVPPWSGFSPKSSRSSIMATISNSSDTQPTIEESRWHQHEDMIIKAGGRSIDLSFKLEWKSGRRITLLHHSRELGVFQL